MHHSAHSVRTWYNHSIYQYTVNQYMKNIITGTLLSCCKVIIKTLCVFVFSRAT